MQKLQKEWISQHYINVIRTTKYHFLKKLEVKVTYNLLTVVSGATIMKLQRKHIFTIACIFYTRHLVLLLLDHLASNVSYDE